MSRPTTLALATLLLLTAADPRAGGQPARAEAGDPAGASSAFPASWEGHWKGDARVLAPTGPAMTFRMELIVAPTTTQGRWTWTLIYDGDRGRQERKYHLVVKDAATGAFVIDEGGGVELPMQLLDGALYGQFAVGGTRITSRDRIEAAGTSDERLVTELITTRETDPTVGGGKEGVPEVRGYPVRTLQVAALRRLPPATK